MHCSSRRLRAALAASLITLALPSGASAQQPAVPADFPVEEQAREPFRIFDNLYYIGIDFVSAYLIPTSEGLIVVDALFEGYGDYLLDNVREAGFDPADIRYVIVTHAHRDHFGAAAELQARTGATVGMAPEDWPLVERAQADAAPRRDWEIQDGEELTLGDTTLRFHLTPGHTPGVVSIELTVYDGGMPHKAFSFGGAGINSVNTLEAAEAFVASLRRVQRIEGIEVSFPNHPFMNDTFARAGRLDERGRGEPHPFVAPDEFYGFIAARLEEAEARLEELSR